MPEPNSGETKEEFVHRCIPIVLDDGTAKDQDQAVAVCSAMFDEAKKNVDEIIDDAVKIGARNSQADLRRIQDAHELLADLGATCRAKAEVTELPLMSVEVDDDELVNFGDAVKALGDGKLGGYLVRFSTDEDPDLTGEFFTRDTDFGDHDSSPVYYNHGLDKTLGKRRLGKATLRVDDFGVWAEAQLNMRDEYEKYVYQMGEMGKLGYSSGSAPHLVEKEAKGKAVWIKKWPLGLDASLTPTPAEPRNGVIPLKSIEVQPLMEEKPMDAPASGEVAQDGGEPEASQKSISSEGDNKMEITEEKLQEIVATASEQAVEKAMKALPAVKQDVKVEVDEADQPFPASEFFQAVKTAYLYPGHEDKRLLPLKATGLSEGVPADGGYLLAPQVAAGIQEKIYSTGQILNRVAVINIGPNSNSLLINAVDESSRADGSRFGGLRGYWMSEGYTKTSSKPAFRQMELKLKKVAALCYATDELLADATALESFLSRTVPLELKFQVENAIYNGNGVGKPLGIMQSPCLVSVTRQDANQVDGVDIANMWSRRYAGVSDYVWLANPTVFPQLINATIGNFPLLMPVNGGARGDPSFSLYGRPYIEVEYSAALGTTGDIMLASLSQYQTIQKGGVQSASSIHVQFVTDETAFRFIFRIDGEPLWSNTLTPYAGSTLSPFVVLTSASA